MDMRDYRMVLDTAVREGCAVYLLKPDGTIKIVEQWWKIIVDSRAWTGR